MEATAPRHLDDDDEDALVSAVMTIGSLRDRTIILLMLHTGLRARDVCTLQRSNVVVGKRSGLLKVYGKRNKYREVPLNATARKALAVQRSNACSPPECAKNGGHVLPIASRGLTRHMRYAP